MGRMPSAGWSLLKSDDTQYTQRSSMPERLSPAAIAALLLLLSMQAALYIGDFGVRLASTHGDDGPVLYSLILNGLDTFDHDMVGINARQLAWTSVLHLVPAGLQRYAGVP